MPRLLQPNILTRPHSQCILNLMSRPAHIRRCFFKVRLSPTHVFTHMACLLELPLLPRRNRARPETLLPLPNTDKSIYKAFLLKLPVYYHPEMAGFLQFNAFSAHEFPTYEVILRGLSYGINRLIKQVPILFRQYEGYKSHRVYKHVTEISLFCAEKA